MKFVAAVKLLLSTCMRICRARIEIEYSIAGRIDGVLEKLF